ncbi:hypothetical protein ES708_35237 [subsurface metagenome]
MKKFFIILSILIVVTVMGGCLNLASVFPVLNVAPIIISEPIITATEDQLYLYQVEASDPNEDTLTYSSIIKPEGMNINSENGLIIWTPTNDQVGINRVEVEISDGKLSVTQSFEIEVSNVNNPPQILSYSPDSLNIVVNEGESKKFEVQAHDIDLNTTLSYRWFLSGELVLDSLVPERVCGETFVGERTVSKVGWAGGVMSSIVMFHCIEFSNSPSLIKIFTIF